MEETQLKQQPQAQGEHSPPAQSGGTIGRLEAFSDGVFAIAITLLILEIAVPHGGVIDEGKKLTLWQSMLNEWQHYLVYVIGFISIGIIWINHHITFRYIYRVDRILLGLNVLLLMGVSFIPHSNAILADNWNGSDSISTATAVYTGTLLVTAVFYFALWQYALRRGMINPRIPAANVQHMTRSYIIGNVAYLLSFILSFFFPTAALIIYGLLALYFFVPQPTDRF